MHTLTTKQKAIFDFISTYIRDNGLPPTIEEIRKKFTLNSLSTVHSHVEALIDKGYLSRTDNYSRGLEIAGGRRVVEIPVLGKIAAGLPIEAVENHDETVSLTTEFVKDVNQYYALKVTGNSMIDEGIFDGDLVVIKRQSSAENGQTVVAIIDDGGATLKKLYRERGGFRLQPANQSVLPLFRKDLEIRGVVVQIIRNCDIRPESAIPVRSGKHLRTVDLFAGVGGVRLGFERAGFKTVFANDFEKNCKYTYDLNFKDAKLVVEDIRNIHIEDLPEFDFLLGGFPCQAFSIAGYRRGFEDEKGRGNLFFDVARIIEARKPEGFLLENVKNLKTHDGGRTFKIIEETLTALGYGIKSRVLNSMEYGNVPQNRERIYIVGFKNKEFIDKFEFPKPVPLQNRIDDILDREVPDKYYYNGKPLYKKLEPFVRERGKVYQWRRQYVRENKKGVCPTLTANMGMGGHNVPIVKDHKGIRKLTPIECARIQGFPRNFQLPSDLADSALYKQMGNSVTVSVIEGIAKAMVMAMSD